MRLENFVKNIEVSFVRNNNNTFPNIISRASFIKLEANCFYFQALLATSNNDAAAMIRCNLV